MKTNAALCPVFVSAVSRNVRSLKAVLCFCFLQISKADFEDCRREPRPLQFIGITVDLSLRHVKSEKHHVKLQDSKKRLVNKMNGIRVVALLSPFRQVFEMCIMLHISKIVDNIFGFLPICLWSKKNKKKKNQQNKTKTNNQTKQKNKTKQNKTNSQMKPKKTKKKKNKQPNETKKKNNKNARMTQLYTF